MLADLVLKNRSYRRFYQEVPIPLKTLRELVDLARLSASGTNRQPLKYILSCDAERNALIFSTLAWAALLPEWVGPEQGERPSAYIVVLNDKEIMTKSAVDHGIAAQSILLGATEKGFGGCMLGSIKRERLRELLGVAARYEILLVLALGKPKETVVIEPLGPDGNTKYWRDAAQVHHVPKRSLDEIIIG
ncbi:MAG: nitroreductase family protein [Chloroflexota bacterium]